MRLKNFTVQDFPMESQRIPRQALIFAPKPGRSEVELIKKNVGKDGLFADPDFPPEPSSLYVDGKAPEGTNCHIFNESIFTLIF